jgi:hypothetical protein
MHVRDHVQSGQARVPDLAIHQMPGHHPDDLAAGGEHSIRHHAHESDPAAAVDDADARTSQINAELLSLAYLARSSSAIRARNSQGEQCSRHSCPSRR